MFKEKYKKLVEENYKNRFKKYKGFNRNKFNYFIDIFKSFSFHSLQDFYTFARVVEENEINLKDFIKFIEISKDALKENIIAKEKIEEDFIIECDKKLSRSIFKCPECSEKMDIRSINIPKGKRNLKGWKTHFFCEHCGYEEFSHEELYKSLDIPTEVDISDIRDPDIDNLFGININDIKKEK